MVEGMVVVIVDMGDAPFRRRLGGGEAEMKNGERGFGERGGGPMLLVM